MLDALRWAGAAGRFTGQVPARQPTSWHAGRALPSHPMQPGITVQLLHSGQCCCCLSGCLKEPHSPCPRHIAPQPLRSDGAGCPVLAHEAAHHAGPGAGWDSVGRIVQGHLPSRLPCRPTRHRNSTRSCSVYMSSWLVALGNVHLSGVHRGQAVHNNKRHSVQRSLPSPQMVADIGVHSDL